jgi:hypothetical protein
MNNKRTSQKRNLYNRIVLNSNGATGSILLSHNIDDVTKLNAAKKRSLFLCVGWIVLVLLGICFVAMFLFIQIVWIVTFTSVSSQSSTISSDNNHDKIGFYNTNSRNQENCTATIKTERRTARCSKSEQEDGQGQQRRRQLLDRQTQEWIERKRFETNNFDATTEDQNPSSTISYFNGVPVIYTTIQSRNVNSHVHCVGNTYQDMFFGNDGMDSGDSVLRIVNRTNQQGIYNQKYFADENEQNQYDSEINRQNSNDDTTTKDSESFIDPHRATDTGDAEQEQLLLQRLKVKSRRRLNSKQTRQNDRNQQLGRNNKKNNDINTDESWKCRSCYYTGLFCFNMSSNDYVVFQSYHESIFQQKYLSRRPYFDASSSTLLSSSLLNSTTTEKTRTFGKRSKIYTDSIAVSIGGINQKWKPNDMLRLKWSPKVIPYNKYKTMESLSYYELPPHIVLIPYHSLNGANPGHLVWDDFLPMYTLLDMFQLLQPLNDQNNDNDNDENIVHEMLPMRYVLPNNPNFVNESSSRGLWASCDWKKDKKELCLKMINKFKSLLVGADYPYNWTTTESYVFNDNIYNTLKGESTTRQSDLICSKHGISGIGALTDHGTTKLHGWEPNDYKTLHNSGRGRQLYEFRNFMIRNVNLFDTNDNNTPKVTTITGRKRKLLQRPYRVVFSQHSSDIGIRDLTFDKQIQAVKDSFSSDLIQVANYTFKDLSVPEQISIVSNTAIYISLCGGGAVSGMFVPKGASILLYYSEHGGIDSSRERFNYMPALLDYDLFNSLTYVRVHWLPLSTVDTRRDVTTLIALIQHEIEKIEFLNNNS